MAFVTVEMFDVRMKALENTMMNMMQSMMLQFMAGNGIQHKPPPAPTAGGKKMTSPSSYYGNSRIPIVPESSFGNGIDQDGWKVVERKTKKKKAETNANQEKGPALSLRPIDWDVPVRNVGQLHCHADGVCFFDDQEVAEATANILDGNCDDGKKVALVTYQAIEDSTHASVKFDCKLLNAQGRLTTRELYYTNMGNVKIKPGWIKNEGAKAPVIPLINNTDKILVHIAKEYCSKRDWESGKLNPGALFRDVYAKWGLTKYVVHTFRPKMKELNGQEMLEQVLVIQAAGKIPFIQSSGKNGSFVREFLERNEDGSLQKSQLRIVWLGTGVSIETAMTKLSTLGDEHCGLVFGRSGLGIRVKGANLTKTGEAIYGDAWNGIGAESRFYEISHVPIWVVPDELKNVLFTNFKWDVTFVRTVRGGGDSKKLIYRANAPPPADAVRLGGALLPIQEAQPIRSGSVTFKMFVGKTQKENKKKVVVGESPQEVSAAMDVVRTDDLRRRIDESDPANKRTRIS